ncbi:MAG: prepilin-type N-terminal cleavage/methylation domain-containing protein [Planctomycetes bacterium]|nr:prepilin-type N-terminal cleavage/methylation domain-containing protein [Planctomycetota bacterium]
MSARRWRRGFTLAEVAVTIALIGLALAWMLQVLNAAKLTAAYSRNLKLSRELALLTLGQIEAGEYADDLDHERLDGTYAEEGYPDFSYEVVIGDENFRPDPADQRAFDNWQAERSRRERERRAEDAEESEEDEGQAYEKIQIKVSFPKIQDMRNDYILERWLPWRQLYPEEDEDAEAGAEGADSTGAGGEGGGNGNTGNGGRNGSGGQGRGGSSR